MTINFLNKKDFIEKSMLKALDILSTENIQDFELLCNYSCSLKLSAFNNDLDFFQSNIKQYFTIKIYNNFKIGETSTNDFSNKGISLAIKKAIEITKYTEFDKFNSILDKKFLCNPLPNDVSLYYDINNFNEKLMFNNITQCLKLYKVDQNKNFNCERLSLEQHKIITGFANSNNFFHIYPKTLYGFNINTIYQYKNDLQNGYEQIYSPNFDLIPNYETLIKSSKSKAIKKINAKRIISKNFPIILSPEVAESFWEYLLISVNGYYQYQKNSFLLNALGKKITNENINIIENSNIPNGIGNRLYDCEGVNFGINPLITQGVLNRYILNNYSAKKLNFDTTGNCGGISNIIINSTNMLNIESLIGKMNTGIIINEVMGDGFNVTNGDYSQGAAGVFVEEGVEKYPINNFTISGNIKNMLLNVIAISDNINKFSQIITGSVLIDNVRISSN